MSKGKSSGRHRQQAIPQATVQHPHGPFKWEDLENIYAEMARYCLVPTQLAPLLTNREACSRLADLHSVVQLAEMVSRDVERFSQRLLAIRNKHRGRTGPATDADDGIYQIVISEEYLSWQESFNAVVMPNVMFIQEQFANIPSEAPQAS